MELQLGCKRLTENSLQKKNKIDLISTLTNWKKIQVFFYFGGFNRLHKK